MKKLIFIFLNCLTLLYGQVNIVGNTNLLNENVQIKMEGKFYLNCYKISETFPLRKLDALLTSSFTINSKNITENTVLLFVKSKANAIEISKIQKLISTLKIFDKIMLYRANTHPLHRAQKSVLKILVLEQKKGFELVKQQEFNVIKYPIQIQVLVNGSIAKNNTKIDKFDLLLSNFDKRELFAYALKCKKNSMQRVFLGKISSGEQVLLAENKREGERWIFLYRDSKEKLKKVVAQIENMTIKEIENIVSKRKVLVLRGWNKVVKDKNTVWKNVLAWSFGN